MADKDQLTALLEEIAALLELKGENPFKTKAYHTAAQTIANLEMDLAALAQEGTTVKGIGKTIGQQIAEFALTGHIAYHDELKSSIPAAIVDMVKIPGLGPKKAWLLYEKLEIQSVGELEYACRENRLQDLKGFGAKTQQAILTGIEYKKRFQGRFLLCDAWPLAEAIASWLASQASISQAEVAGSIRRRSETVSDLDIVVASQAPEGAAEAILAIPGIDRVVSKGTAKISLTLQAGMNLDVRIVAPERFAGCLHHFTGSKDHNIALRARAKELGLKLNEYGLTDSAGVEMIVGSEAELYRLLGLAYIPPELREGRDELITAEKGHLPELITRADLNGLFHVHTLYSDGTATIRQMAEACRRQGLHYVGITDHSRTAVYAKGLTTADVLAQRREIDALNQELGDVHILAGIESDILPDGTLDYPDEVLAGFDFVIASVHSAFRQSEAEMTKRICQAMRNPYVTMLGHPTGRILLGRPGYAVDMAAVIAAAGETGTMIEINANPYRLDIDWRLLGDAKRQGVLVSVNPDAHSIKEIDHLDYGIAMARKGGLTAADVVNTRTWEELRPLLRRKVASQA